MWYTASVQPLDCRDLAGAESGNLAMNVWNGELLESGRCMDGCKMKGRLNIEIVNRWEIAQECMTTGRRDHGRIVRTVRHRRQCQTDPISIGPLFQ